MRIYFTASIRWRKEYGEYYVRMTDHLQKLGHEVSGLQNLTSTREQILQETIEERVAYYKKFLKRLKSSQLMVAEVSSPSSVNVGHEISVALDMGIPVLAFHYKGKIPVMISAIPSEKLISIEYSDDDLEDIINDELNYVRDNLDERFTMIMPGEMARYLDQIADTGISRSEFIRNLIEREMGK